MTGDVLFLQNIPFEIDDAQLAQKLHVKEQSGLGAQLKHLAAEARAVANPKAFCRVAYIEDRGDDFVVVDGVRFASRVLRVNLEPAHRLFAYVATCGTEMDAWSRGKDDMLESYWADALKEMALRAAIKVLHDQVIAHWRLGRTAAMAPGSLADWPLTEQPALFRLLGDGQDAVGVRLTESCLMVPTKSVSGVRFPTEESFESCQLCPRDACPGRRAPYDPELYNRKYGPVVTAGT